MQRTRDITAFFVSDQDRLNVLLEAASQAQSAEQCQQLFMAFRTGLRRHIQWEESLLYPVYEKTKGSLQLSPTGPLSADHRRLETLMDAALAYEYPAAAPEITALKALLEPHNQREARMIYPTVDSHCPGPERDALLAEVQDALAKADDLYCLG
ncbi:hemerythrin domain-containing protein [Simiduia agarivorans]|uniref:Hemerythrin-like domain-containing protein n=1 Tax=Simiduia agarivorans (strain DSM 21679 / JCM 13881 / BCRC 17597 / SA1) TaxID=1117647 RepID=K4KM82_SIMAS|nr:hemerythrin domain-containing protein [Simiduia agarivorans]AFV00280.1 hypothetical protein M5M_15735 [Simiduia agarivorans SA1 = DSM 21679]